MAVPVKAPKRDWQNFGPIKDRARHLLENPEDIPYDITFLVGRGTKKGIFKTHKLLLALGSSVFHAMLYGPLKETRDEIPLFDVTVDAFANILLFIYSDDDSGLNMKNVMQTLYAAKKYLLDDLISACRVFVQDNLRPIHAVEIFRQSYGTDEDIITEMALTMICSCTKEALVCRNVLNVQKDILGVILARQDLSCTELELYHFLRRWADQGCAEPLDEATFRDRVGDLIYSIRFPCIKPEEFMDGSLKSAIPEVVLKPEDASNVPKCQLATEKPETSVCTIPREPRKAPYHATFHVYHTNNPEDGLEMKIELRPDIAPVACEFFRYLVESNLLYGFEILETALIGNGSREDLPEGDLVKPAIEEGRMIAAPGVVYFRCGHGVVHVVADGKGQEGDFPKGVEIGDLLPRSFGRIGNIHELLEDIRISCHRRENSFSFRGFGVGFGDAAESPEGEDGDVEMYEEESEDDEQ